MEELLRRVTRLEERVAQLVPAEVEASESAAYTPTATGATTAGAQVYTVQLGRYTRVGRTVTAHIYLNWSSNTGTGTLVISLPFAASSSTSQRYAVSIWADGLAYTGDHLQAQIVAGESRIQISGLSAAGTRTNTPVDSAAIVIATATYETDG